MAQVRLMLRAVLKLVGADAGIEHSQITKDITSVSSIVLTVYSFLEKMLNG